MNDTYVPPTEYNREFIPASNKGIGKAVGAEFEQLLQVPIDNLVVDPTFNVRVRNRSHEEHIEKIAASITNNGFYRHKALPGYAGKHEGREVVFVVGGFSRYEAAQLCRSRGVPIERLPVILKPHGTNTADMILALANDNTGEPLKPFERAIVAKRLKNFGWSERKIADGMGHSQSWVNALLSLLEMPEELQQLVISEQVAATHVIDTVRRVGVVQATP